MASTRSILMLGFPGFQILDITGPLQMFAAVNDELASAAYAIEIAASQAGPLKSNSGMQLHADTSLDTINATRLAQVDTLLVPGGSDDGIQTALAIGTISRIFADAPGRVRRIASVCSGTFFLADAGLLNGRRVTTHWRSVGELKHVCPEAHVHEDAIHIQDGEIWSSAGVTAGIDLALAMIEADHGRDVALAVARRHVVYRIRPGGQSQFSPELAGQSASDSRIVRLAEAVLACPEASWTVETLAETAGLSLRSLSRLFQRELGMSPAVFVERARVDAARQALLKTDAPVELIAHRCGFASPRRMHRAFARILSVSPTEFRNLFKTNGETTWHRSISASSSSRT